MYDVMQLQALNIEHSIFNAYSLQMHKYNHEKSLANLFITGIKVLKMNVMDQVSIYEKIAMNVIYNNCTIYFS